MIRLFGKIRQKLLLNKMASKYLLYAIGEVVLVVIGILIALQINNWNINNQETKELQGYLKNVQNNLQTDLRVIEEIKTFRDSSMALSKEYLKIAMKDTITVADFDSIWPSNYNVFWDLYFKPHKSGFEVLKNSGFIGKLSGTKLEENLNDYYYLYDIMHEKEISLNNTIEAMEIRVYNDNILQRIYAITKIENKEEFFSSQQNKVKELFNHPSMIAANERNARAFNLPIYYREMDSLAKAIISEIDNIISQKP